MFTMISFFSDSFMVYALIIGLLLALGAALLSPFLVLNRQAMIADGLSHVAFTGIILGLLTSSSPLYIALPFTALAALALTYLANLKVLDYDASIGVISSFSLALGLIIVAKAPGFNRSIESLLVGSILTVTVEEIIVAAVILVIISLFILIYYRPLLAFTYDATFSKTKPYHRSYLKYFLAVLTSVFIVVGIRSVGMLLMSALIIFPALITSILAKSFQATLLYALILSFVTIILGMIFAYYFDTPMGSMIVVIDTFFLLVTLVVKKLRRDS